MPRNAVRHLANETGLTKTFWPENVQAIRLNGRAKQISRIKDRIDFSQLTCHFVLWKRFSGSPVQPASAARVRLFPKTRCSSRRASWASIAPRISAISSLRSSSAVSEYAQRSAAGERIVPAGIEDDDLRHSTVFDEFMQEQRERICLANIVRRRKTEVDGDQIVFAGDLHAVP